eukprot:GHVL01028138.1.p2 GENE.GHVL01028138.1~~GHVL01028138.1.p2  ORF type:complete len:192 (+),score=30.31 GHVL01028138.1:160-735(+)
MFVEYFQSIICQLVFRPPAKATYKADEVIFLDTPEGGKIAAIFFNRCAARTILFSHGNAEDIGSISQYLRELSKIIDVNILTYDYTGYGHSVGTPREALCYNDIETAYNYLISSGIPANEIILYGKSVGSGPSVDLAARHSVRGLIIQSGFTSVFRVVANLTFTLPGDMFVNKDKVGYCYIYIYTSVIDVF